MPGTIFEEPFVSFGRESCGDLNAAFRREWLVTNGIGGYASGTLIGVSSRSHHGQLVGALEPPAGRIVLVGASVEQATYRGRRHWISTNEYADGVLAPDGYRNLAGFMLDGTLPIWTYAIADASIERRLWMVHGENTTYVSFNVLHAAEPVEIEITPLVTYRDHHTLTSGQGWQMQVEHQPHGALDKAFDGAAPLRLLSDIGEFRQGGRWYWNFRYRAETERGLYDHGDLYAPGTFTKRLEPGEIVTVIYSVENEVDLDGERTLTCERARQRALLERTGTPATTPPAIQQLMLTADQFIVSQEGPGSTPSLVKRPKSIIAGYHWFADWSRDTMISLPGLTLATGRPEIAAEILRGYAALVQGGLLPNNFSEQGETIPARNSVDASLWYINAIHRYWQAANDKAMVTELLPTMVEIIDQYLSGTHYGISVDPADGLLRGGEDGVQLTWMDAKVDDWVVTPRIGKPVEINALWYNALHIVANACLRRTDPRAGIYVDAATKAQASFRARFTRPETRHLADVVDGPHGDDWSIRPNQIFALSLPYPIVEGELARSILDTVGQHLLTSHGLRTLAPAERSYTGSYLGDRTRRDGAYHQGTVWAWLLGPYAEAVWKVTGDAQLAKSLLHPMTHHLRDAGLGSISEIFDGDPPHQPRGAISQAWSVGEVLRVWRLLDTAQTADVAD
jgi:predicted glycogen debranching enzyme